MRDRLIALLLGSVDGIEVVADGRWLANDATHATWLLGRQGCCDVQFATPTVSRRHALITKRGRCWSIVDLGAKNGTLVNGAPILRPAAETGRPR